MLKINYQKYINSMRLISLHAIKQTKQGHVGMSMSVAPITYTLFTKHLNITSKDPKWINRDRLVLSAGHGVLGIYSILHFCGLISKEELKNYKNSSINTPGHPETLPNNFIDASTGPLGQGVGMAIGMAIAQKYLENKFNHLQGLINHYTYIVVGDGDLQEGISYEAMSLAGKLKLNKLIVLHDSNDLQIDSSVETVNNEDLKLRFEAMHWFYLKVDDSVESINLAIELAKKQNKPSFIEVKTTMGFGTKWMNSSKSHSASLTDEDINYAKQFFNLNYEEFEFDSDIYFHFKNSVLKDENYELWKKLFDFYQTENSEQFQKFHQYLNKQYQLEDLFKKLQFAKTSVPTRNYVKDLMKTFESNHADWIIAGCADLEAATNIKINSIEDFNNNPQSNNLKFGIREFAMGAITNGILLHSFLKTISGTFLAFSDYLKSAIRLGALMQLPNFYIFTHDCYQVGGDGPTHQPIEQLAMLRSIPNVNVFKPCDEKEFAATSLIGLNSTNKTNIMILTRHPLNSHPGSSLSETIKYGGYIIEKSDNPDISLVGGGTEIDLLYAVRSILGKYGYQSQIISVPCLQKLLIQPKPYLQKILNSKYGVFSVESSSDSYWYQLSQYVSKHYHFSATQFGISMDGDVLYKQMGFNADNLSQLIINNLIKS